MITALVCHFPSASSQTLGFDLSAALEAAGVHAIGAPPGGNLVREVARLAPDVFVCQCEAPDDALFELVGRIAEVAPVPVLVFTSDADADRIAQAVSSGVHAYVVNGCTRSRLRPLIHLAQARFRAGRAVRDELADLHRRFDERKLVDRAKGILMRARQWTEDEAFRALRNASMHSKRKVGQVSHQVIEAARYADAVNRAGQLRMLSQRLVKLETLRTLGSGGPSTATLLEQSLERIELNIADLRKSLSEATYGDLIDAVADTWGLLRTTLAPKNGTGRLGDADALADRLLQQADRLTATLEAAGVSATLHVINVAGRQRMLSQRVAKRALLAAAQGRHVAGIASAEAIADVPDFEEALIHLDGLPLATPDTRELLANTRNSWAALMAALPDAGTAAGQKLIGESSEALLEQFERLTDAYERSMHLLMG